MSEGEPMRERPITSSNFLICWLFATTTSVRFKEASVKYRYQSAERLK